MSRLLPAVPLLIAAGCTYGPSLEVPVHGSPYRAAGDRPSWWAMIGTDEIAFRKADEVWQIQRRRELRVVDGVRIWRSREPNSSLTVEARREPCTDAGGQRFEDRVDVRLRGVNVDLTNNGALSSFEETLSGCGGRQLREEDR